MAKDQSEHISFLHILANSGQSSGGHTALLIGNKVYHFQYNFNDKILHLMRDPWEEFRFHYTVWENRSIRLFELGIPNEAKDKFKSLWDEAYLIQRKWIENLEDLKSDAAFITYLNSFGENELGSYPISGLGYFNLEKNAEKNRHEFSVDEFQKMQEDLARLNQASLDFSKLSAQNEKFFESVEIEDKSELNVTPPIKYNSLFKLWEEKEQKKFVREFLISGKSFDPSAFLILNHREEFALQENDKVHLNSVYESLHNQLRSCLIIENKCNGMEEIVLLVRRHAIEESLKTGYFVVPKKAIYNPFYYADTEEIPDEVLEQKKIESIRLFHSAKKQFLESSGDFVFAEWEKDMAKIDSLQRKKFDIVSFEPYPSLPGNRELKTKTSFPFANRELLGSKLKQKGEYEKLVQKIYPYHIILQNCTGEIFRYHNQFYRDENDQKFIFGGTISEKTSSFSFIPFLAAYKVRNQFRVIKEKEILSFRLQKLNSENVSTIKRRSEDIVPLSSYYQKNPYDQEFFFFTDDTVALRPIYGLTNIMWGLGHTTVGIFTLPWDRGKKFTNGAKSIFFSFPEVFFFNIRKGYFPYVTEKDLPASYYEKVYE